MKQGRLAIRVAGLSASLAGALALHGAWRSGRRASPWPRRFLARVARIAGARARIVGQPLTRDVMFVANHQSWLDIPLLAGATGTSFVAKAELARTPLVGWLCGLNRTLFIERADRLGIADQVQAIRDALARGQPLAIFPEGTTGDGRALLPFKPALFAALDPAPPGIRVQPVRIDYGPAMADLVWPDGEHGQTNAARVLRRPGRFTATLTFCPPFDPADHPGRKAIATEARRRIEDAAPRDCDTPQPRSC